MGWGSRWVDIHGEICSLVWRDIWWSHVYIYIHIHTYTYVYMYVWFRIAWLGQQTSSFWIDYGLTSCNLASQGFKAGATIFKWSNLLGGHADGINLLDQLDQSNLCGVIWLNLILVWSKLAWECLRWCTVSWKYIYIYIYLYAYPFRAATWEPLILFGRKCCLEHVGGTPCWIRQRKMTGNCACSENSKFINLLFAYDLKYDK